ncbi:flavin reductase family protein [Clostridium sp.]|uniref:flavin reductase family protein n=1 Tax=Clostridium sp. TaxID=1506 RepID=UPI0025BE3F0A|nr:flavin reductase family protein [Clostridium sp.]MBS4957655.1 flavin reductase family protein [Clostridium sp.]MDU4883322.1 flavin reductase family protein [Clostridium celatum]MDU7076331.1 flavin reductase family protein [Clostridium celatum]
MKEKVEFKGSVVLNPVPVVLITSKNKEGKENVFTVGWIGTVCTKPPMLSISIRPERLSYEYIKETMEFTVNLPSINMTKAVDYCGVRPGRKFDKIKEMNFTMREGSNVNVSYIDECPVSIECKVKSIIPLGTHDLFIADVVGSHIDKDLIDEKGKIHFEEADLITYCHGEYFKMDTEALGKFGYSVAKNPIVKEKKKKENTKKEISSNSKKKVNEKSNTSKEDKVFKKSFKNKKSNKNKGKKNFSEKKSTKSINKKVRKTK